MPGRRQNPPPFGRNRCSRGSSSFSLLSISPFSISLSIYLSISISLSLARSTFVLAIIARSPRFSRRTLSHIPDVRRILVNVIPKKRSCGIDECIARRSLVARGRADFAPGAILHHGKGRDLSRDLKFCDIVALEDSAAAIWTKR